MSARDIELTVGACQGKKVSRLHPIRLIWKLSVERLVKVCQPMIVLT